MSDQFSQPQYTEAPKAIEDPLNEAMQRIMAQPNVVGALVSDKEGLCVGHSGTLLPINSARASNIYDTAIKMGPDHLYTDEATGEQYTLPESPIIILETSHGQVIINNLDGFSVSVAIAK